MIGDFGYTREQAEAIVAYIKAGRKVEEAISQENVCYRNLLMVLGEEAYCPCCGNQHWPLCEEEEDDTDDMP